MIILFYLNYFGITHLVLLINTFCLTPPPPPPSWTEFVLFIRCLVLVEMLLLPSQNRKYGTLLPLSYSKTSLLFFIYQFLSFIAHLLLLLLLLLL